MSKTKKRICIVAAVVIVLLLTVDLLGANYLVSFAIGRTTSGGASVAPPPSTTTETRSTVSENTAKIVEATAKWAETIEYEPVFLHSDDGLELAADLCVTDPDSHRWAIMVHGYTARRQMMRNYGAMYARYGFNLLMPDLRAHGESEGNYIGMGWPDRLDILKWIDMIISRDPEAEILLTGISMGGATVMMTAGEELPANVKAVVEDCGYTSVWDIFADEMDVLFHLPTFPLLNTASYISSFRAGYNFTEASSLNQVKKAKVPILFIHGAEDNFVHTEMVYKVYEACQSEKDILVIDDAGHGQAYYYAPDLYEAKVAEFLEKYM